MVAAAARIASISACAVGSRSRTVRLPARANTAPSRTIMAPIGTSPAASAARAAASASSMKDNLKLRHARPCAGHPRLYTHKKKDVDGRGQARPDENGEKDQKQKGK